MKLARGLLLVGMLSLVALGQAQSPVLQPSSQQLIDSGSIAVVGAVHNPGVYKLEANTSIIDALAKSGGMQPYANRHVVLIIRPVKPSSLSNASESITLTVDMDTVFKGKVKNVGIQAGDTIVIPGEAKPSKPLDGDRLRNDGRV
jgi:protein involved in polysaccharide export with SLBB domain